MATAPDRIMIPIPTVQKRKISILLGGGMFRLRFLHRQEASFELAGKTASAFVSPVD